MSAATSSPLSLFRSYPRAAAYQAVLIPAAMGVGAVIYAKLLLATQYLNGAAGLGQLGLVFSLSCGAAALVGGWLADRLSARWLSGVALALSGAVIVLTGALLDRLSPQGIYWATLGMVWVEGVCTGLVMACHPVVLAALVLPAHRGAADLINNLRVGVGVLIGMQWAQAVPTPQFNLCAGGGLFVLAGILSIAVTPPIAASAAAKGWPLSITPIVSALRERVLLRRAVATDMLLKLAVPSQLGALYLADLQVAEQAGLIFGAGLLGVLLSGLWLAVAPPPPSLSRSLRRYFSVYMILALVAPLLLIDRWLVGLPWLAAGLLFLGSYVSAAAEAQVRATVQQEVPDAVRGRINGSLGAVRNVLSAVFGALHAAITHITDIQWLLGGLLLASVLVWIFTRGFVDFDAPTEPRN